MARGAGIFGASAVFLAAKQLGHSVAIAEKNYQGVVRGIPREARTLEAAMEVEGVLGEVLAVVRVRTASQLPPS